MTLTEIEKSSKLSKIYVKLSVKELYYLSSDQTKPSALRKHLVQHHNKNPDIPGTVLSQAS